MVGWSGSLQEKGGDIESQWEASQRGDHCLQRRKEKHTGELWQEPASGELRRGNEIVESFEGLSGDSGESFGAEPVLESQFEI